MKPILFNTEMVQAILDGRKTVTRRAVKPQPIFSNGLWNLGGAYWSAGIEQLTPMPCHSLYNRMPYHSGDTLWVRETWAHPSKAEITAGADPGKYLYRADELQPAAPDCWHPSIHMPREAARLFLRVTDVRAERLQKINGLHAKAEGCDGFVHINPLYGCPETVHNFKTLWDTTIKPADRALYGWDANPWVWVIEFERISKEEAYGPTI